MEAQLTILYSILTQMIASLHDKDNHITIPGFYDNVDELSLEERAKMGEARLLVKIGL